MPDDDDDEVYGSARLEVPVDDGEADRGHGRQGGSDDSDEKISSSTPASDDGDLEYSSDDSETGLTSSASNQISSSPTFVHASSSEDSEDPTQQEGNGSSLMSLHMHGETDGNQAVDKPWRCDEDAKDMNRGELASPYSLDEMPFSWLL